MSSTDLRTSCPKCHSSDNLCQWTYEGKQFQKCVTPNCLNNKAKRLDLAIPLSINELKTSEQIESPFLTGDYKDTRGLTAETCRACGIMVQGNTHIFQYKNSQKIRIPNKLDPTKKDMYWKGNHSDAGLFMEHMEYDVNKPIIICEGEADSASCYQAGYQAYSIKDGAGEKKTADEIRKNLKRLSEFKEIIFWFDSDNAGQAALKEVLEIEELPLEKVKIVQMPETMLAKDANEVLIQSGTLVGFIEDYSHEYVPDGILIGSDLTKQTLLKKAKKGLSIPWPDLNQKLNGLQFGKLILIGGGSNIGKTPVLRQIGFSLFNQYEEIKEAMFFLEEQIKETGLSYLALEYEIPLSDFELDPLKYITKEQFDTGYKKYIESNRLMFTNEVLDSKHFWKSMDFAIKKGFNVFFIDHISLIIDASQSKEGERKDIDRFMYKLSQFVKRNNILCFAACHLSNPDQGLDWEDGREVKQKDFRGSGSLRQYPHIMIGVERNLRSLTEKNKSLLRVVKNRGRGSCIGASDVLYYHDEKGTLTTIDQIFE